MFDDAGNLQLLNSPALSPEELNQKLHDDTLREWSPIEFDPFAAPYLAPKRFWNSSRFVSVIERMTSPGTPEPATMLRPESEAFRLALACMRELQTDAQAVGARLVAVHLSTKSRGSEEPLVTAADREFEVINTSEVLRARLTEIGAPLIRRNGSHYSAEACQIIGEFLARWTLENGP